MHVGIIVVLSKAHLPYYTRTHKQNESLEVAVLAFAPFKKKVYKLRMKL